MFIQRDDIQSKAPFHPQHDPVIAVKLAKEAFAFDYEERQIEKPDPRIMAYLDVTDDLFGSFQATLLEEYTNAETFVSIAGV
ncbi:MAG: hypothetical protein IH914_08195 [candidate division Zixibacteria bacterium]|nr:hypothetical protein [candidate division Zixibacteria bacterium]